MKEEKIDITLNQEDVQNIIDCYEKDIELIEKLKERNKIYKTTIKGQHKTIIELRNAKKASKKVHKERNKKLKEENEQLKERIEYLERSNDRREETIIYLGEENIDYETRIDNAIERLNTLIEFWKKYNPIDNTMQVEQFKSVINILGGKNE
jgi:hypothetical protein